MPSSRSSEPTPDQVSGDPFSFSPTSMLVAGDDQAQQICHLTVRDRVAGADATLRIRRGDIDRSFQLHLPAGTSVHELQLPESREPRQAAIELDTGDQNWTTEAAFAPVRRWQVFFVNHSHTDIGFTHTPSAVVDVHNKNLARALEFGDATEDWPSDARYRWTCESAWQVQNYLRAHPEDRSRLAAALHAGVIEVEALYIHSYFDLLSREQLVRSLTYAQRLREELGATITSAMISDVPGSPWSLVDLLDAFGVRYLSMAPNNFLAPFHATTDLPRPFVWRGPAAGRVFVWYTDDPYWAYIEGSRLGFWDDLESVEAKLPAKLDQLVDDGYPFDAVQIQLGSDNRPLRLLPAKITREWNQKYLSPRIRMATPSSFFRHAEKHWSDLFQVVCGEWQSSWSQTTLHYPHEAAASRRNHGTLDLWERLAVIADWMNEAFIYPNTEIDDAYDASLLFDEHSGPKGIWHPHSDEEEMQALREGYQIFEDATLPARDGLATSLASATGALASGDEPEVVVWNLLSWPRSGAIDVAVPADWIMPTTSVVDDITGDPAAFKVSETSGTDLRCCIQATDVPAMGYKRYRFSTEDRRQSQRNGASASVDVGEDRAVVENERLSVTVDASGRITSLVDVGSGTELVDTTRWPGLNAFIRYVPEPSGPRAGGDFHSDTRLYDGIPIGGSMIVPAMTQRQEVHAEPSLGRVTVSTGGVFDDLYRLLSEISLHEDWIQVTNRLFWLSEAPEPDVLYVLFPFALPEPEVRHASQYAVIDPQTQTLSGSSLDSFAIQNWLDLSVSDHGVTLHSADLPLVDYGGINHRKFLRELEVDQGCVGFPIAAVRTPPQDSESPFGNQECLEFRFAFRPYPGAFDALPAHRFGEAQALPLQASALPARHPGFWTARMGSLVQVHSRSVMVTALKRADAKDGYIVRLWESAGQRSCARLSFPEHILLEAWEATPVEEDIGRVATTDGEIRLELGPFQTATFRCVLGR